MAVLAPATTALLSGWSRANAVLGVYLECVPCSDDVMAAATAWAEAVDEAAAAL